jgi:osmotically-inducible protein OsmY
VEQVEGHVVTLVGVVRSFHAKQLAQNIAARCPGVEHVNNHLCVEYLERA